MTDPRKDLPPVSAPNFNERLRETISTYLGNRGNPLDRGVTLRDLSEANIIALRKGFLSGSGGKLPPISGPGSALNTYEPDLTPPPTPSGFTASAAISHIFIECDAQPYPQGHGHAKTVVYGATWTSGPLPVFGDAVKITEFSGTVFAHPTNPATTWHLWIKWVSVDGVESASPAGGTNGVVATTGQDVRKLVEAMTGPGNPFKIVSSPITLADGTIVPVGTYTSDAYMASFVASRGQIGLLAVDDARIASLKVSKLEGDSLKVGSYISSSNYIAGSQGFRINADGLAEFSNVVVRGTVYATAGVFTGTVYASSGSFTGAVYATSGSFTGTVYANAGEFRGVDVKDTAGNIILSAGSSIQNQIAPYASGATVGATFGSNIYGQAQAANIADGAVSNVKIGGDIHSTNWVYGSSGWYLSRAGALYANSGEFRGQLVAATGTFSGSLTASAVNAVNTINIAGNAVTTSKSVSGGSFLSTNLNIPAGQTMNVAAELFAGTASGGGSIVNNSGYVDIGGLYVATGTGLGLNTSPESGGTSYSTVGFAIAASGDVAGGAGGRTLTITASAGAALGTLIVSGFLR